MNILTSKSIKPIVALVVAALFLMLVAIIISSNITHADNGAKSQNGRLLTIHDRGEDKIILSQAATVGDALKEANVVVDAKDAVEPAVDTKLVASDYQINIYR